MDNEKKQKVYSKNSFGIVTFFGGPLAGLYMMYKNFKALGKEAIAKKTLLMGIIIIAIFYGAYVYFVPEESAGKFQFAINILAFFILYSYMIKTQVKDIDLYVERGGKKYSGWNAFGVFIVSVFLLLLYVSLMVSLLNPV